MIIRGPVATAVGEATGLTGAALGLSPGSGAIARAVRRALLASSSAAMLASGAVLANPQGGNVVAGQASIATPTAGHMQIDQTSQNAVIDWRTFSIGTNESVQFAQPSSTAATVNRVTGGSQSFIDGLLSANGRVLILNSEGVLFGRNSHVNVGGLLATTSDIANTDFMSGKLTFHGTGVPGAAVVNQGTIHVADQGLAALVAPTVANSGVIEARLGRVALASGEAYTLDFYGDHLINFAVGQGATVPTRRIDQTGTLVADGGQVAISSDAAAAVVSNTINLSGVIQARSVSKTQSGQIVLEAPESTVNVTGTLDATGQAGASGGTVDLNAANINVGSSGSVDASAVDQGSGGNVKLWGTDTLALGGGVAARGGALGGNGGSVDLSTSGGLSVTGAVDLQAPHGTAGSLLLDPASITVDTSSSTDPTASTVNAGFLSQQLRSGTNVTLAATDSITVDAAIDGRPSGGSASANPSGAVSLTAGSLTIAAPIVTDRAAITLNADGTGSSGNITFTGSNPSAGSPGSGLLWVANCSSGCASGSIGSAPVTLKAGGDISADTIVATNGQIASLGAISLNAGGSVSGLPALNGVTTGSGASGIGPLTITAGGPVSLQGANVNGAIDVTGSSITTGSSSLYSSSGGVTLSAGSGGIAINAAVDSKGNPLGVQADGGGNLVLATSGDVKIGSNVVAGGSLCIGGGPLAGCGGSGPGTAAGNITAAQTTLQAGSATGAGGIDLDSSGSIAVATLRAGSSGAVILNAAGDVSVGTPISGYVSNVGVGSLNVTAGGNVTLNGANVGVAATNSPGTGAATVKVSSGGALLLNTAPIVSRDGIEIDLTQPSSGLTIDTGTAGAAGLVAGFALKTDNTVDLAHVLDGSAGITIARPAALSQSNGAIVLENGLLSTGSVNIGSASARIGAVCGDSSCATPAATIQAGADKTGTASIAIYSGGPLSVSSLPVGETGSVTLDGGGSVTVSQPLSGFAGSLGIGSLTVHSGQDVSLQGGTVGQSSAITAPAGTATVTAAAGFTTGGSSLIARDGISISAGTTATLDAVTGGAALVAGYDAHGAFDAVAGHLPAIEIEDAANSASLGINTDGGILAAGNVLIGTSSRVGQVTSVAAPGTVQAGDSTNNPAGSVSIDANQSVTLGPVLVGPQGAVSINASDTASSTSGSITFGKGLYGFASGGTQLGIGSLTVDSEGTIAIPGVTANQTVTLTGYGPGASVHAGYLSSPGDVTRANGAGPWSVNGDVGITLHGGDLTFAVPAGTGGTSFDLTSSTGSIDIEGAGNVTIPDGVSAGKGLLIGASTPVSSIDIPGSIRSATVGSSVPSTLAATGDVTLGPWMAGEDQISPDTHLRNAPIAGGISITGATVTTGGIAGYQTPTDDCCFGVGYITIDGSQGVTVNGFLASYGVDPATAAGIGIFTNAGKTIAINQSLMTVTEDYLNPGGLTVTPLGSGGPIVIGDRSGYHSASPVTIDLSADVSTLNQNITFNGDVTLFSGLAYDHTSAVASPFYSGFDSNNPSSDPGDFPDHNFLHITDVLVDSNNHVLAEPTEPSLSTYFVTPPAIAGAGGDTAGWQKALGQLTAVVDAGNDIAGGTVTFQGSVTRSVPAIIPTAPGAVDLMHPTLVTSNGSPVCQGLCNVSVLTVPDTYVNVQLVVHGSAVNFNGPTGDPVSMESSVLGVATSVPFGGPAIGFAVQAYSGGLPPLGYFKITASGIASDGTPFTGWSCANAGACANYITYDPSLVDPVDQTFVAGTTPNVVPFYYRFDNTNQGQQDVGLAPITTESAVPATVTGIYGLGAFAANPLGAGAAPGTQPTTSAADPGTSGLTPAVLSGGSFSVTDVAPPSATPPSTEPPSTTEPPSGTPTTPTAQVASSATGDTRRESTTNGTDSTPSTQQTCPRGAGHTADLGERPGQAGASPNVFALCGRGAGQQQALQ